MKKVKIGEKLIGDGEPCFFIAEIGINHNGDLQLAKQLIAAAKNAGADAVKFQKRTVDVVYSQAELDRPRESPFGTTNRDLKDALEFGAEEYAAIDAYCKAIGIMWFASCWDEGAIDFMESFNPPCYKIASASLTDDALMRHHRKTGRPLIISTGMSSLDEMDHAVDVVGKNNLIMLHCTSTYPSKLCELNLNCIPVLKERYNIPIGYSGHEVGLSTSIGAAVLGVMS